MQLNAGLVGTLLLVSKLFDGVTDLVAGFLVDCTNTKLGRARPYDITYALFALFTLFLFNTPRMGKTLMAVYVFVMYTLIFSVFQTLYSCASTVYLSRVIETDENRVKVNSISSVISAVIAIIVGIALPLLIEAVGTSHEKWGQMAIYICAPCVVLALVRLFTIKETSTRGIAASATINLKEGVYLLFHNKYVLIYALALLLTNIATNFGSATTYYFKYIVQNLGLMSLVQIGGIAGPVAIAAFPALTKKLGMKKLMIGGLGIGVIGKILPLFGKTNIVLLMISSVLSMVSYMPLFVLVPNVLMNCMDYGEWKYHKRGEGIYTCVTGFCSKVGVGLAAGIIGIVTSLSGYVGGAEVQSASAQTAIVSLYTILPALLMALSIVAMYFYNLDKELPTVQKELAERSSSGQKDL